MQAELWEKELAFMDEQARLGPLAMELIGELDKAMAEDIATLDWMGAETKQRAKAKLAAIAHRIGYPDKWRDYSSLMIVPGDFRRRSLDTSAEYQFRQQFANLITVHTAFLYFP